jgi:hypothetical protein
MRSGGTSAGDATKFLMCRTLLPGGSPRAFSSAQSARTPMVLKSLNVSGLGRHEEVGFANGPNEESHWRPSPRLSSFVGAALPQGGTRRCSPLRPLAGKPSIRL